MLREAGAGTGNERLVKGSNLTDDRAQTLHVFLATSWPWKRSLISDLSLNLDLRNASRAAATKPSRASSASSGSGTYGFSWIRLTSSCNTSKSSCVAHETRRRADGRVDGVDAMRSREDAIAATTSR